MATHKCKACLQVKNIDDFYEKDNTCKECRRIKARQRRYDPRRREKVLAYDRARGNRQSNEYRTQHREKNEKAYKARNALNNAVRDGKIFKPNNCEQCGTLCKPHGHHFDYNKPLTVIWLCAACHRKIHSFMDLIEKAEKKSA